MRTSSADELEVDEQASDILAEYMDHLEDIVQQTTTRQNGSSQAARIKWLLDETFSRLGQGQWEMMREGRGTRAAQRLLVSQAGK